MTFTETTQAQNIAPDTNIKATVLANWIPGNTGKVGDVTMRSGLWVTTSGSATLNSNTKLGLTYLKLDTGVTIPTGSVPSSTAQAGQLTGNLSGGLTIYMQDGGWLDIDADYTTRINISSMSSGTLYLNQSGALTLGNTALGSGVVLDFSASASATAGQLTTRTLLTGTNFTGWMSALEQDSSLVSMDGYTFTTTDLSSVTGDLSSYEGQFSIKNADGALTVSYVAPSSSPAVPEPATATLSLLALAGLCARRRRK